MGVEEAVWTKENVGGKVFPCEDQGGRGIPVAVASGVATWLHCGRSLPGIQGPQTWEDSLSPSQSLMPRSQTKHFCQRICIYT
jgi:hypothetical protein